MALIEFQWNPSSRDLRIFAVGQVVFFGFVAAWIHRRFGSFPTAAAVVGVSLVGLAVGLAKPQALRLVYVGWMAAVYPIGWVVSHVLMAAVYYGVVTPVGLLMRLAGRDPMQRRFNRSAATYWTPRNTDIPTSRYFRQS
ncbi:MAG: hypothetical protein IT428_28895 [Planctomycetaceae bacterium]|nr:hypothetical protein [Planctomycetaceae bacterium]